MSKLSGSGQQKKDKKESRPPSLLKKIRKKLRWLDPFTYVDEFVMPVVNPKKKSSIELVVNIFFAAFFAIAFYTIAGFLLSTEVPGAIVYSYSMVPVLSRGDFIAMQGVSAHNLNAETIDLNLAIANRPLKEYATTYCSFNEGYGNPDELKPCDDFLADFIYGKIKLDSFSTRKIAFRNGKTLDIKKSGDTVLYFSSLSGKQIIHRAVAKINAEDGTFILTKGDSGKNPVIDQDYPLSYTNNAITFYATPAEKIKGRIFFTIPIIGYAKILIFDDLPHLIFGCRQGEECYFP